MKKISKGVILSLAFVLPTILVQGKAFAVESGKAITKAELLREKKLLAEGVYDANRSVWDFHLKDVALPKNYDFWGYENIQLKEVMDEGKIPASLELLYDGDYILEDSIILEKEAILSGEVL